MMIDNTWRIKCSWLHAIYNWCNVNTKVITISMLVTRLLSSSQAPQWRGSAWIASTNTSTASFSRSSFRSTTPYLCSHTNTHCSWSVHCVQLHNLKFSYSTIVLTGTGWTRPTLLLYAFYWAPPSVLARLHCAPDPSPEDLESHRKTHKVQCERVAKIISVLFKEVQTDESSPKLSTVSSSFFFSPDWKKKRNSQNDSQVLSLNQIKALHATYLHNLTR